VGLLFFCGRLHSPHSRRTTTNPKTATVTAKVVANGVIITENDWDGAE